MALLLIHDRQADVSNPLFLVIGLALLIMIFSLAFFLGRKRRKPKKPKKLDVLMLRKIPCPICFGTAKIPDQAHDSDDIQFMDCGRCGGTGEVLFI